MSENQSQTVAEILINSAVKTVGKRDFLKTVEKIFNYKTKTKTRTPKTPVTEETQCQARVKGERTGVKIGRHVLFEQARCDRKESNGFNHLCAVHNNQVEKFGSLPYGLVSEELNDDLRKTFV